MPVSIRIVLGISAAALLLSLARAPAAFAQDPMAQDIDFKNSMSRNDGVRKDAVSKAPVKKAGGIKKDGAPN